MRIKFIKDHVGQQKRVGDEVEIEDHLGKHLMRFGYANELPRLDKTPKKVGKDVEKSAGDNDA